MNLKKILVVAHDAGGANILASLIDKYKKSFHWIICLAGPAKGIFLQKNFKLNSNIKIIEKNNIREILDSFQPKIILTGTGWESNFETLFLKEAKKAGIKTAAFLDHWSYYRERFGYPNDWIKNLPDYIFVGDKWSYKIALKDRFPKNKLIIVENPYFEEIVKQAEVMKQNRIRESQNKKIRILYLSQPTLKHALKKYKDPNYWGYTEYKVVKDLLKILNHKPVKKTWELKIRLHPAEKLNKYTSLLKNKNYQKICKLVSISNPIKNSLIGDCMWADIVIGSSSMALVIALMIGKRAISYIPAGKQICALPQKEIKKIYTLGKLLRTINELKVRNNITIKNITNNGMKNLFAIKIKELL